MQLSNHAVAEMQQRVISETTVHYLIEWGPKAYDHKGAIIRCFDKSSRAKLWVYVGEQEAKPGFETNDKKQGSLNILRREDRRWTPALISPFAQTPLFDHTFYRFCWRRPVRSDLADEIKDNPRLKEYGALESTSKVCRW